MLDHLPAVHHIQELPAPADTNHRRFADKLGIDLLLKLVPDGVAIAADILFPVEVRRDIFTTCETHEVRELFLEDVPIRLIPSVDRVPPHALKHILDGEVPTDNVYNPMHLHLLSTDEFLLSAIPLHPCKDANSF